MPAPRRQLQDRRSAGTRLFADNANVIMRGCRCDRPLMVADDQYRDSWRRCIKCGRCPRRRRAAAERR